MNAIEFRLTRDGYAMQNKRKYQRHNWLDILILCGMLLVTFSLGFEVAHSLYAGK